MSKLQEAVSLSFQSLRASEREKAAGKRETLHGNEDGKGFGYFLLIIFELK